MDYVREFPLSQIDRRPRKRPRLNWDNHLPSTAQSGLYSGREVGNGTSFGPSRLQSEHSSHLVKGLTHKGSPPRRDDDKDGHYIFELGENLTPRYKILKKIGEGTFGQVLECFDRETREMVAIKVIRSIKKYRDAAMIEVDVLKKLGRHNGYGNGCVQIRNWFDYRNHICIVFEMLGPSLFDFLRRNSYRPFPVDLVREIGRQLLECVACLFVLSFYLFSLGLILIAMQICVEFWFCNFHIGFFCYFLQHYWLVHVDLQFFLSWVWLNQLAVMHDLHLIHTDLKPENILFVSSEYVKLPDHKGSSRDGSQVKRLPKSCAIKVIDFGSTASGHQIHHYLVSTRHYRAPEVILGLGWSYPCDMWSVGCILAELCSGEALFQTHDNLEHLAMMERVLGSLPEHMLRKVDRHAEKYTRRGRLNWPEGATSRESIRAVQKLPRLQNWVMQSVDHSAGDLIDLLQGLLQYEPSRRVTAHEALRHPFFTRINFRVCGAQGI